MSASARDIMRVFTSEYKKTPMRVKFAYVLLVGTFPFNGFLAGFLSSLGFFALTSVFALGKWIPANKDFAHVSPERAFADYVLANLVLHLVVWTTSGDGANG
ncbi:DAD family-domain-containing protein [Haematococcus lacustris]